jgi:hypothetical protein
LQDVYTPRESLSNKKIAQCDFSFTRLITRGFVAQQSGYSYRVIVKSGAQAIIMRRLAAGLLA